jgi:hypothetical protein
MQQILSEIIGWIINVRILISFTQLKDSSGPEFVKLLRNPGIVSQPNGGNRFLGIDSWAP